MSVTNEDDDTSPNNSSVTEATLFPAGATTTPLNVDAALSTLGGLSGRFQRLMLALLAIIQLPCGWLYLADAFTTDVPQHHCHIPINGTIISETADSDVLRDEHMGGEWYHVGECLMQRNVTIGQNGATIDNRSYLLESRECVNGWEYIYTENVPPQSSLVPEWDLVCDRQDMVAHITTIFFAGDMLGALVLTSLSDIFGRKRVFIATTALALPFALGAAFAPNYITFVSLRFFGAVFLNGSFLSSWTLLLEYLLTSQRAVGTQVIDVFWAAGLMSLAGVALALRNWRYIFILSAVCYLPITILILWIMPESMHFLLANGRIAEAEAVILKIAKFNKIQLPKLHLEGAIPMTSSLAASASDVVEKHDGGHYNSSTSKQCSTSRCSFTFYHILTTPNLRLQAVMSCFVWFVNALVYYGLSLASTKMSGNKYLNFFIISAVEVPAYLICAASLHYFRRRWPIFSFHLVAGVSLMLLLVVPHVGDGAAAVELTLVTIGKLGITAAFAGIYMYTPELFPTLVRNSALGLLSICSRVGAMTAPQLARDIESSVAVPILFGSLAIVAALVILLLPETARRPLPETLDDVSATWRRPNL